VLNNGVPKIEERRILQFPALAPENPTIRRHRRRSESGVNGRLLKVFLTPNLG
jgi:hypothetical protein